MSSIREITIRKPDDMHLHLRQGEPLKDFAQESGKQFKRAIVMPNTLPPVVDIPTMLAYKEEIESFCPGFEVLPSFKILPTMSPSLVKEFKEAGALIGKLYPAGATTNAEDGVSSLEQIEDFLGAMEAADLVLSIHGEVPSAAVLSREIAYHEQIEWIVERFPRLRIVFEHISSKESLPFLESLPSHVVGTVTVHHLLMTLDDLIGGSMDPHLFCKPVVKLEEDRAALVEAVCSGHPRLFFGSDSAPHPIGNKVNGSPSAGAFTSPVALALLVELFDQQGALDKLEDFVSVKGAEFYGLPLNSETITLIEEPWIVKDEIAGARPWLAGQTINWKVK